MRYQLVRLATILQSPFVTSVTEPTPLSQEGWNAVEALKTLPLAESIRQTNELLDGLEQTVNRFATKDQVEENTLSNFLNYLEAVCQDPLMKQLGWSRGQVLADYAKWKERHDNFIGMLAEMSKPHTDEERFEIGKAWNHSIESDPVEP